MKKTRQFALLFAAVLTGAVGLTGCSSANEEIATETTDPVSPGYNPATNEVTTKFIFSVSPSNSASSTSTAAPRRQPASAVQATDDEIFRGIDNAVIFSHKSAQDGKHLAAVTTVNKRYDLSQVLAAGTIDKDNSHRVIETSLPLNTNTLLFYGKAIEGNAYLYDYPANDVFGHLDEYTLPEDNLDLNNVTFSLGKRLSGANLTKYRQIENLLSAVLTIIMNTNLAGTNHVAISATATPLEGVAPYGFNVAENEYPADLTWASYANADGKSPMETSHALYPLEKKLADVYREMTAIKHSDGEVRAGSGYALKLTMHDLWSNINEVRCATPLNKPEAVAKYMAHAITKNLREFFGYTLLPSDGTPPEGVVLREAGAIKTNVAVAEWPASADAKPTDFSSVSESENLNDFPLTLDMPYGASHLQFDATKKQFSYVRNFNTSAMDGNAVTVEDYVYPAELLYFGNSPLRASNKDFKVNGYPTGVANWDKDESWSAEWVKNSHVTSSTQSVAMQNDINYGTAMLKTTVKYNSATLNDNNHAIQKNKNPEISDSDEPDNVIEVNGTTFQLTGIIVGGQAKSAGWNFLAKSGEPFKSWVYDKAIASKTIPANGAGTSTPNYTLLFDNYKQAEHQDKVYVALEFLNNSGKNFFGEHGLVRDQSHFYLIGELDPEKSGLNAITWPTHHPLPPYNADGTSIKTPRVFMQDFVTTADFVIGVNSLKHAYLTVPDLRYSALTLGLSVDLKWETGLNFEDVLLGGE